MIRFTISPPSLASLADSSGGPVELVASLADCCCADTEAGGHLCTARAAGFRIRFQEGTCHSTLTALAQELPQRVLREFSRHRDARSLDHTSKPRATPEAIVRALGLVPGPKNTEKWRMIPANYGGADGTRTYNLRL
jgi:hypothetical protein